MGQAMTTKVPFDAQTAADSRNKDALSNANQIGTS
jgi:hypothetical protein